MACRLLPFGESLETGAVDHKNVGPAIVIEVEGGNSAAGGLDDIALCLLPAVFGFSGQAGFFGDVNEVHPGDGRLGRSALGRFLCPGTGHQHEHKKKQNWPAPGSHGCSLREYYTGRARYPFALATKKIPMQ